MTTTATSRYDLERAARLATRNPSLSRDRQDVFIDRTLRGEYQSSPGNNEPLRTEIRRQLREIADGRMTPTAAGTFLMGLLHRRARPHRDCLTQEDFYVIGILCRRLRGDVPALDLVASFAEHDITRVMQSPAMLDRYRLGKHQLTTTLF